ncbi:hypothetical protein HZA44_02830 [Candidatus Peregrinibacteria bacterium]|nr:hypothetical protein [Candidatus Peregrinibacteria bacterium]
MKRSMIVVSFALAVLTTPSLSLAQDGPAPEDIDRPLPNLGGTQLMPHWVLGLGILQIPTPAKDDNFVVPTFSFGYQYVNEGLHGLITLDLGFRPEEQVFSLTASGGLGTPLGNWHFGPAVTVGYVHLFQKEEHIHGMALAGGILIDYRLPMDAGYRLNLNIGPQCVFFSSKAYPEIRNVLGLHLALGFSIPWFG